MGEETEAEGGEVGTSKASWALSLHQPASFRRVLRPVLNPWPSGSLLPFFSIFLHPTGYTVSLLAHEKENKEANPLSRSFSQQAQRLLPSGILCHQPCKGLLWPPKPTLGQTEANSNLQPILKPLPSQGLTLSLSPQTQQPLLPLGSNRNSIWLVKPWQPGPDNCAHTERGLSGL